MSKINPVVGGIIVVLVLVAVGFIAKKMMKESGPAEPTVVKVNNPNAKGPDGRPLYQADPKLAGGGR